MADKEEKGHGRIPLIAGTILDAFHEFKFVKKRDLSLKCKVKLIQENAVILPYDGILTEDLRFLYCEKLGRCHIKPKIFEENGKRVVYITEKSHGKIDWKKIKGVAEAQKYHALVAWKFLRNWISTEVQSTGTIDWLLFDNDFSPDFASDTWLVSQSNAFRWTKDLPNIKVILIGLACWLFGCLMMSVIYIIFFMIFILLNII